MDVVLLYFEGCPNWRTVHGWLADLEPALGVQVVTRQVRTPEEAERIGFAGSPTVLIDGRDPFPASDAPSGLTCRVYVGPDGQPQGLPPEDELRRALERAARGDR